MRAKAPTNRGYSLEAILGGKLLSIFFRSEVAFSRFRVVLLAQLSLVI